jgi:type IV pilus assembly protein PilB
MGVIITSEKKTVRRLGDLMLESGLISTKQLEEALEAQKTTKKRIGDVLVEKGFISERQLVSVLEYHFHVPFVDLTETAVQEAAVNLVNENLAKRSRLIPFAIEDGVLSVAMADPLDLGAIEEVRRASGQDIKVHISLSKDIQVAIDRHYGKESAEKAVQELNRDFSMDDLSSLEAQLANDVSNAPVVRLVNSMIQHAIRLSASDIHIEPMEDKIRVRFRVDGELQEVMTTSKGALSAIVTRIKIMGGMDIAEKRVPQDGRVETTIDGSGVDMRLSILPTVEGEKIVIRLLGRSDTLMSKTQLGFTDENLALFDDIIKNPNGIFLICGPTGSGKTTTLYTALSELNKPDINIVTVEDPVEYRLNGVNQVQVNMKAGMTFASGLRSILRQDPDIILIGEIRDAETAQIAVRSAITGHLVLSTIHTNDAVSSISRLVDMGIEPYLLSSSMVGIVAQRLVRRICPKCKTSYRPDHNEMMLLKLREPTPLYRGAGCQACNFTGYSKRIAIHEIVKINKDMRELINRRATLDQMRAAASRYGTTTLRDNCVRLVMDGVSTTEELLRVTYSLDA